MSSGHGQRLGDPRPQHEFTRLNNGKANSARGRIWLCRHRVSPARRAHGTRKRRCGTTGSTVPGRTRQLVSRTVDACSRPRSQQHAKHPRPRATSAAPAERPRPPRQSAGRVPIPLSVQCFAASAATRSGKDHELTPTPSVSARPIQHDLDGGVRLDQTASTLDRSASAQGRRRRRAHIAQRQKLRGTLARRAQASVLASRRAYR